MLKQRIITALIMVPVAIIGVFFLPPLGFTLFIGAIICVGAWEWANVAGFSAPWQRVSFAILMAFLLYLSSYLDQAAILWGAGLWWVVALALVATYPRCSGLWSSSVVRLLLGLPVLIPAWVGLEQMNAYDDAWQGILYIFVLVWGADIGAYFAGRGFGKMKLAPNVSPKKSWEGVFGGLAVTSVLALSVGYTMQFDGWLWLLPITWLVTLVSVLGDLLESMFKRERGIKDSSQLLPGHGGILDRIDSLTAAVPIFALALMMLGA